MRLKNCAGHEGTAKAERDHSTKVMISRLCSLEALTAWEGQMRSAPSAFAGSGTATSRLCSKLSPSIAWRKTTKSALRETLWSHMGRLKGQKDVKN